MVDQDFQTGEVGPLDPAVVTLVVLQRVVARPELIARPAFGGVGAGAAGDLLHQAGEPLGPMVNGAVVQGMIDTEGVERVTVIDPAADELIGGNMAVRVDEAEHIIVVQPFHVLETGHLAQIVGRAFLGHGGVELRFRIGVTTLRGEQVETVGFALQRRRCQGQRVLAHGEQQPGGVGGHREGLAFAAVEIPHRQITGLVHLAQRGPRGTVAEARARHLQALAQFPQHAPQGRHRIQYQVQGVAQAGDQVADFRDQATAAVEQLAGRVGDTQQLLVTGLARIAAVIGQQQIGAQCRGLHIKRRRPTGIQGHTVAPVQTTKVAPVGVQVVAAVGELKAVQGLRFGFRFGFGGRLRFRFRLGGRRRVIRLPVVRRGRTAPTSGKAESQKQ